ncbi:MAG: SGNH/GDSL hydrolase family protein [Janthinobacterium lividum]
MAACLVGGLPSAAFPADSGHWVAAWATAAQSIPDDPKAPSVLVPPLISHLTIRQIIYPRLGATRWRLRLSNVESAIPVRIEAIHIASVLRGAATQPASDRTLTFGGSTQLTLEPGQTRASDTFSLPDPDGGPLAVSLYIADTVKPGAWHRVANQTAFLSTDGNHAGDTSAENFRPRSTAYYWLAGLDAYVENGDTSALVAIGDSITDGMRSSLNMNRRWPDGLARRFAAEGVKLAVLNLGISGNRLLSDSSCYGPALLRRFERDALTQPGVKYVAVLEGINDINFADMPPHAGVDCDAPHTRVSAASMIAGYRQLIAAAHARGVRIYGATLTPADLPPAREALRQQINGWIRSSGQFDAVLDFDLALRDPARPTWLQRRFDSGDHIHPSDPGYAAMAAAIPLQRFAK